MSINRVILIVLDSVGIGALPDAHLYNDEDTNTLGNIAKVCPELDLPNLTSMGLGNIDPANILAKTPNPSTAFGKAMEQSAGKDTTTGHWEICGVVLDKPFPTFPNGFPEKWLKQFEEAIGIETLGNKTASGTTIIEELGEEHLKSKKPIVYTSADSVFQIAMHEAVYPIKEQYRICQIARELLTEDLEVARVIARPFIGSKGNFIRTKNRKDFSIPPPDNLLDALLQNGKEVFGIGKIVDIFSGKGISRYVKTANNAEGMVETIKAVRQSSNGLIFTNLVDFDMLYGHRRDPAGYARALMDFDRQLPDLIDVLKPDDLLIITADHGNDPTAHGTDHTREYIPILNYGNRIIPGKNIGLRKTFADISATIAAALNVPFSGAGNSYLRTIIKNQHHLHSN